MNVFKLYLTTDISEGLRYRSFTWLHFFLLLMIGLCVFFIARHFKEQEPEQRKSMLKGFAIAVPCVYLYRFTVFLLLDVFVEPQMSFMDRLPFHLCTINAVIMPVAVLKKNKLLLNYIYAIALPGAAAAMLTPAMSYYGRYFYFSWQILFFFIDHGLMTLIPILAVLDGTLRPNVKMLPKVMLVFLGYAALIYPINKLSGQNYLFLNYPDQGTVMAAFAHYMGNPGYLIPLAALVVILVLLMYIPWIVCDHKARHMQTSV